MRRIVASLLVALVLVAGLGVVAQARSDEPRLRHRVTVLERKVARHHERDIRVQHQLDDLLRWFRRDHAALCQLLGDDYRTTTLYAQACLNA